MYIFHSGWVCGCRGSRPVTGKEEKNMKKAIAIVLLAVMILGLLAACGGGDGKYIGKYQFSKATSEGETVTLDDYADMMGISVDEVKDMICLELKSGGKGTFTMGDEPAEVTWKIDGEKITLTAEGENAEGTIKNGVISLGIEGETLELVKAK